MSSSKALLIATVLLGAVVGSLLTLFIGRRPLLTAYREGHRLLAENEALRAEAALGPAKAAPLRLPAMQAIHTRLALQEASRDALPTAVAHPLKFRGFDTPQHAIESFFWACYNCNPDTIAQSVYLDPAARTEAEKARAALPPEMQARYPTPESLYGMLKAYDSIGHPMVNSEDYFIGYPPPETVDATTARGEHGFAWRLTADGWKVEVSASRITELENRVWTTPH